MIQLHQTVRKFSYNYSRELNFFASALPTFCDNIPTHVMLHFIEFPNRQTILDDLLFNFLKVAQCRNLKYKAITH